jgi:putative spermidine/putrescine transport system ATP-binding protein
MHVKALERTPDHEQTRGASVPPMSLRPVGPASKRFPEPKAAHTLSLVRLRKTYGPLTAVDDVSLDVPRGEFLTLLGPSGSGKTTLLMMIAGFVEPSAGEVLVDDRRITHIAPERRNFGMVFQGYALFPHMSVAQNIAYPLWVRRVSRSEIAERVKAALALVRLEHFESRMPRQLSGGQQQRVAIARALVFEPDILLFDEPLGALDRKLRAEMQVELKTLHAQLGTTFIYVTHDQDEALSMSDRIAILDRGRLVQTGAPGDLYEQPRTRFVAEFLGTSNCFSGVVSDAAGDTVRLTTAGREILHRGAGDPRLVRGSRATFALRPEKVSISTDEPTLAPNRAFGRIVATSYLGAMLQVIVDTAEFGRMTASCMSWQSRSDFSEGALVWMSWPPEATTAVED